jgi:hypothetical protein
MFLLYNTYRDTWKMWVLKFYEKNLQMQQVHLHFLVEYCQCFGNQPEV